MTLKLPESPNGSATEFELSIPSFCSSESISDLERHKIRGSKFSVSWFISSFIEIDSQ